MSSPTFVAAFSNDSGNSNVTSLSATLPTVQDGDEAYIEITSSRGSGAWTGNAPSGWTGPVAGGSGGDTSASATCTTQIWRKTLAASDSGTTVTVTGLSGRLTIGGIITRGGVFEQVTAVNQTGTGANPSSPAITPIANDCLLAVISGYVPATGVSTTLTPPAGYTEQLEAENSLSTTFRPGAYFATKALTGQAGTSQGAATITASTKPNANTYALTIAPSVPATVIPSTGYAAARAPAPTVTAAAAPITAQAAPAGAAAPGPAVTAAAAVSPSTGTAKTGAPSGTPSAAAVAAPSAGRAHAGAPAPSTSAGAAATVLAAPGVATAVGPRPAIASAAPATILATPGAATTGSSHPTVTAAATAYPAAGPAAAASAGAWIVVLNPSPAEQIIRTGAHQRRIPTGHGARTTRIEATDRTTRTPARARAYRVPTRTRRIEGP